MPHPREQLPGHQEIPGAEARMIRKERRGEPAQIGLLLHPLFLNGLDSERIKRWQEQLRGTPSFATAERILGIQLDHLLGENYVDTPAAYYTRGEVLQLIEANHTMEKLEEHSVPKPNIVAGFGMQEITAAMIAEAITFDEAVFLMKAYANGATTFLDTHSDTYDTLFVAVNPKASFIKRARQEQTLHAIRKDIPDQWKEMHLSAIAENFLTFGGTTSELHEITEWIKSYSGIDLVVRRLGLGLPIHTREMFPVAASIGFELTQRDILDNPQRILISTQGEQIRTAKELEVAFINGPIHTVQWKKITQFMREQGMRQQVQTRADGAIKFVAGMSTPQQVMVGIATVTTLAGLGFFTRKLRERR